MDYKDYYKILGVPPDADKKVIKQTYRQLEAELTAQRLPASICVWYVTERSITRLLGSSWKIQE